jgi:hypothetical protein
MQTGQTLPPLMDLQPQSQPSTPPPSFKTPTMPTSANNNFENQKPKKKGSVLSILLIVFLVLVIGGGVALWFNLNTVLKSLNTIKKNDSLTRTTSDAVTGYSLDLALSDVVPFADSDNQVSITLTDLDLLDYYLRENPQLADAIGISVDDGQMQIQAEASALLEKSGGNGLMLPISKDSLKGVYVNITVKYDQTNKTFVVEKSTLGNQILDSLIPASFNKGVADFLNNNIGDLALDLDYINLIPGEVSLISNYRKFDVSKAQSLKGTTIPSNFDFDKLENKDVDANTSDIFMTAKDCLEFSVYDLANKDKVVNSTSSEIINDSIVYSMDITKLSETAATEMDKIMVEYDSTKDMYLQVILKVNEDKTGLVVDHISLGNAFLDKYYTADLLEYEKSVFDADFSSSGTIKDMEIKNAKLRLRIQ